MEAPDGEPKRRRKRWGEETDVGKKVIEEVVNEKRVSESGDGPTPDGASGTPEPQADNQPAKKRKSRWGDEPVLPGPPPLPPPFSAMLPASLSHLIDFNSESIEINRQLNLVNGKLAALAVGQIPEEYANEARRSPSPEPLYNEEGVRINTRDQRIKDTLLSRRNELITELIKRNPNYKPPADYRPERKFRKLRIPQDEFPGYNFIGLIIGPRGNTQKRMEKETGARIVIRGKGSVKEGRLRGSGAPGLKGDAGENEDLHVLVTADTEEQLEKAAGMVQKLLEPTDESMQDHKRLQLRELASLNGTLRDSDFLDENRAGDGQVFALPDDVKARADAQYARDVAAVHGASAAHEIESEYHSFMKELGGGAPRELYGEDDRYMRRGRRSPSPRPNGHGYGRDPHSPLPPLPARGREDEHDPCSVYVGYISQHVEEGELAHLFSSFGQVMDCKIIRDRSTGMSKGFGFVRMATEHQAVMCVERLNLYQLGGRRLSVRPRGNRGQGPQNPAPQGVALPPPPPLTGYDQGYHQHHNQQQASYRPASDELPPGVNQDEFYDSTEGCRALMTSQTAHDAAPVDWDRIDREARRERLSRLRPRLQHEQPHRTQPQGPSIGPHTADDIPPGSGQEPGAMEAEGPGADTHRHAQVQQQPAVTYTLETADLFLYGPLPDVEPPPPGLEQEAHDAALQAALQQDPLLLGYPPDPSQYMTSQEYSQYLSEGTGAGTGGDADGTGAPGEGDGGTMQAAGKKKRVRNRKTNASGAGGDGEGGGAPVVVQVVELDPEAMERAKKRREEEEAARAKAAQEKEERLKEIARRRREELAEAAAARVPLPPPPPIQSRQPPLPSPGYQPSERVMSSIDEAPAQHDRSRGSTRDRSSPGRRQPSRSPPGRARAGGRRSHTRSRSPGPFRGRGYSPPHSPPRGRYSPGRSLPATGPWGGRYSRSRSPAARGRAYSPNRGPPPGRARFSPSLSPPHRYSRSRSPGAWRRRGSPVGRRAAPVGRYGASRSPSLAGRRGPPSRGGAAGQFLAGGRSPSPEPEHRKSPVPAAAPAPAAKPKDEEGEEGEIEEGEVADEVAPPQPRGHDGPGRLRSPPNDAWHRESGGRRDHSDRQGAHGWSHDNDWQGVPGGRPGRRGYSGRSDRRGGGRVQGGYGDEEEGFYGDEGMYGAQPTAIQMQAAMMMAMMQGGMLGTYGDDEDADCE